MWIEEEGGVWSVPDENIPPVLILLLATGGGSGLAMATGGGKENHKSKTRREIERTVTGSMTRGGVPILSE